MSAATLKLVLDKQLSKKGDVLEVARLAGIMAAKRTEELIPLCHTLPLDAVKIDFSFPEAPSPQPSPTRGEEAAEIRIEAEVHCSGKTGVEMEALTAVSVAARRFMICAKAPSGESRSSGFGWRKRLAGRAGDGRRIINHRDTEAQESR